MQPRFDDDELTLIGLAVREELGPAALARLLAGSRELGLPLSGLLALPAEELRSRLGLTSQAALAMAGAGDARLAGRFWAGELARLGGAVLVAGRPDYPRRLSQQPASLAPQVLFALGRPSLLDQPSIAVVGSRQPSRAARDAARALAADQAASGTTVVSGGASGIDAAAHRAAAAAGATAVVPAMGLARFHERGLGRFGFRPGGWCAVGQFPPRGGWRAAYALMRNRTVVALSDAVVAFEPRDCGGTWHTCLTALRLRRALFVVTADRRGAKGRGLKLLVRAGAVALDPGRMPEGDALALLVADYRVPRAASQLPLFRQE